MCIMSDFIITLSTAELSCSQAAAHTVFADGLAGVVDRVAVLGVDEDLLGVVGARLELGDVLEAVDLVPRPRRDAANAREVFLGVGAVLRELIAAAERTLDRRWRVHCKQSEQRSELAGKHKGQERGTTVSGRSTVVKQRRATVINTTHC